MILIQGKFVRITIAAYTIFLIGSIIILLTSGLVVHNTPSTVIGMSHVALGAGTSVVTTLIALLAHADKPDHATAVACSYLFRSLGSTCGVALAATAANRVLRDRLAEELPKLGFGTGEAAEVAEKVRHSLKFLRGLEGSVRSVVVACYADGTRAAFVVQTCFCVGAVVAVAFMREKALS